MDSPLATIEHLLPIRTLATHARPEQTLVFLSSSDVYGMHSILYDNAPMREHDMVVYEAPQVPRWNYGRMKSLGETLISTSVARSAAVRIFNCYGPDLDYPDPRRVIPTFFDRMCAGLPLEINSHGRQVRSYCFVTDLVDGLLRVIEQVDRLPPGGHDVFNLGNPGEVFSVEHLAELANQVAVAEGLVSNAPTIRRGESIHRHKFNDTWNRIPEVTKARQQLGFCPTVTLPEGLASVARFYRHVQATAGLTIGSPKW